MDVAVRLWRLGWVSDRGLWQREGKHRCRKAGSGRITNPMAAAMTPEERAAERDDAEAERRLKVYDLAYMHGRLRERKTMAEDMRAMAEQARAEGLKIMATVLHAAASDLEFPPEPDQ